MSSSPSNGPSPRTLGTFLILLGVALLGWVGLGLLGREEAQQEARAELASARAMTVERAPAWSEAQAFSVGLELPDEPPTLPVEAAGQEERKHTAPLVGRIRIPDVGVDTMAFSGIDMPTLDLGAGHFPGTPLPGKRGNVSFAGHRNTDFHGLRRIEVGHPIYVETKGSTHVYRVSEMRVVEPSQVDVVGYRGRNELTLVTCHPFDWVGPAPRRYIVHADYVGKGDERSTGSSR